jgi:hypothetical protein
MQRISKMTHKKAKPEIPTDMWLHVATDALGRYADGSGDVVAFMAEDDNGRSGICFFLPGVTMDDPRFAPSFVAKATRVDTFEETTP